MEKIFTTNKPTKIYFWAMSIFFWIGTYLLLFVFKDIGIGHKILSILCSLAATLYSSNMSLYKVIVNKERIVIRSLGLLMPVRFKYAIYQWNEVEKVSVAWSFRYDRDMGWMMICPKEASRLKKAISIPFLLGITVKAAKEILEYVPSDVIIDIDPEIKQYIDKPWKMYYYNAILFVIFATIMSVWTLWIFTLPGMPLFNIIKK